MAAVSYSTQGEAEGRVLAKLVDSSRVSTPRPAAALCTTSGVVDCEHATCPSRHAFS